MRTSQRCTRPLRDAKDARTNGATGNRNPVSQVFVLLATFFPTIRTSVKRGAAIRESPLPIVQTPSRFHIPQAKFYFIFFLSTSLLSFEFSATAEFSREDQISRLVLTE